MMMPIYPGAPWVPHFHGLGGDLKYQEWKEQIKGILDVQELTEVQRVAIVLGALRGEARRQIEVLDQGERDRASKHSMQRKSLCQFVGHNSLVGCKNQMSQCKLICYG